MIGEEAMPLDQALALADHASPAPVDAQRALQALRAHIVELQGCQAMQQACAACTGAGLAEALQVIEAAALAGHRMHGDDAERMLAMTERMVQQHPVANTPNDAIAKAVGQFLAEYRKTYCKTSGDRGVRANAPLRDQITPLAVAYNDYLLGANAPKSRARSSLAPGEAQ